MRRVFTGFQVVLALAIASRFPPIAVRLPPGTAPIVVTLVGAVLLMVGLLERRLPRRKVGPLWMRVAPGVGLTVSLGLTFFTTLVAQVLGVSLLTADPTVAFGTPSITAFNYFMWTIGFSGVGIFFATPIMVPLLRVLTWPVKRLPLAAAVPLGCLAGALFALGLQSFIRHPRVAALVSTGHAWAETHLAEALLMLLGLMALPAVLSAVFPMKSDE